MSGHQETYEMDRPIKMGQRRSRPRDQASTSTGRRGKQPTPMLGGPIVGSMKRGIKDHSGDLRKREARLLVLCE
jgi:hypothetical protein